MEGVYKCVVRLPYRSHLPEDLAVNDFYFVGVNPVTTITQDTDAIQTKLVAFYNNIPTGQTKQLSDYIGDQVSRTASDCSISYYFSADIAPPPSIWGSPDRTLSWTIGVDDNVTVLPAEVACALSFHGDLTDVPETQTNPNPPPAIIRPAARRRGRVYIGPLNSAAGAAGGPNLDFLPDGVANVGRAAMIDLEAANADTIWSVLSKTAGELYQVTGGYVDLAFDTQRRRGTEAPSRLAWP